MKKRTKSRSEAVEEGDKKIAIMLNISIRENKDSYTLFSSEEGMEIVFRNKKHSVSGDILYVVEFNKEVELKELVFVDSILNLISLIKSKKYSIKSNSVFIVSNNPGVKNIRTIKERFKLSYKYLIAYPRTVQGKIQTLKTILFLCGVQSVRVSNVDEVLTVNINDKSKLIDPLISDNRLVRDFNILKLNIHTIPLGYNVYNLKNLYGYKD